MAALRVRGPVSEWRAFGLHVLAAEGDTARWQRDGQIGGHTKVYTTLKIAMVAPIPSASVRAAMAVKPGDLGSNRSA